MMPTEPFEPGRTRAPAPLQVALLAIGAAGFVCSLLIGTAALATAADVAGEVTLLDIATFGGFSVLGAGMLVLCWWAYYVVGRLRAMRRPPEGVFIGNMAANAPLQSFGVNDVEPGEAILVADLAAPVSAEQGQRILAALTELNATMLMDPAERKSLHEKLKRRKLAGLRTAGEAALKRGDFRTAEAARQALSEHGGEPGTIASLHERIATDRQAVENEALRWTTDHCQDLMAVTDFAAAEAAARGLTDACPNLPGAAGLLDHVERERQAYSSEQCVATFMEIDRYAADRQWRKAVAAANALQSRHPDTAQARAIAEKMPTLIDNARIEEVRELRDQISAMVTAKQYGRAVRLAAEVLDRFPATAAAEALRGQIDRMKQIAVDTGEQTVDSESIGVDFPFSGG